MGFDSKLIRAGYEYELGASNQSGSVPSKRHRSLSGQIYPVAHVPRFTTSRRRFSTQGRHFASKNFTRYKFVFFSALSAPRAFGEPNSVFKNISASIVLVRERFITVHIMF